MADLSKLSYIPLQMVFKTENFNDWLADNTDEIKKALKINEWELENKNINNTQFTFIDYDSHEKIFVYCNMGEFQEENLLNILALTQVNKLNRVIWILEKPQDKTLSALININLLSGKKFLTLMTAQAYKIGNSKPVIEFREH
ncbi:MAG TPA: hypothetical protein P5556_01695 [Candidatus Gastranaerophilales bacterium]|nr:hypothetical protein [Candidatus Gastranaerophilales bacterium]